MAGAPWSLVDSESIRRLFFFLFQVSGSPADCQVAVAFSEACPRQHLSLREEEAVELFGFVTLGRELKSETSNFY